jgi:predicted outer membrane repeat protein
MSRIRILCAAFAIAVPGSAVLAMPMVADAATIYHVTTTADSNDSGCTASLCSFRDALGAAESTGGKIIVPAGHYVASTTSGNGVWSAIGQYTIQGAGANKTIIDGNHLGRTFAFYGQIKVVGVTVTGGTAPPAGCSCGGAFEVRQGGSLTLVNSTVRNNSAPDGDGGGIDVDSQSKATLQKVVISKNSSQEDGGGIHVSPKSGTTGVLFMTDVTFKGDTADGSGGGLDVEGSVSATNVTFAGNSAANGGAIAVASGGTLELNENTIADNTATTVAPGIDNLSSATAVTARNTIVADTASGDCVGSGSPAVTSHGHNLEAGTSCGFTSPADRQNADPKLAGLASAGGNGLPVFALAKNSPAVNAGDNATCSSRDERGDPRPSGKACDIGAFEYQFPGKAKLSLLAKWVHMSSATKGPLRVKCRNVITDRCAVRAKLFARSGGHTKIVGTASGRVAGQAKGKLTIKLNKTGRNLLRDRANHKLPVVLKGTSANRVGSKVNVRKALTVVAATQ